MAFTRVIEVAKQFSDPARIRALHAEIARRELNRALAEYPEDQKPDVMTYVDGVLGRSISSVGFPGVIRFDIAGSSVLGKAMKDALELARRLSPPGPGEMRAGSGKSVPHYRDAWFAMAGDDLNEITTVQRGVTMVKITNLQPYHRKLEMTVNSAYQGVVKHAGFTLSSRTAGICQRVVETIRRKYDGSIDAEIDFVNLRNPYILKGGGKQMVYLKDIPSRGIRAGQRRPLKKDRQKGARMTYPAIVLKTAFRG